MTLLLFCSCRATKEIQYVPFELSKDSIDKIISLIEVDPRPELPLFVSRERDLMKGVTIITINQSRLADPARYFKSKSNYRGHDVYFNNPADNKVPRYIYSTDSPTWQILVLNSKTSPTYYLLQPIDPPVSDTTKVHSWDKFH